MGVKMDIDYGAVNGESINYLTNETGYFSLFYEAYWAFYCFQTFLSNLRTQASYNSRSRPPE